MESPTIGNAPAARIPVESFNLGASSPTSTSSVGTQNQAYITGETAVDCQNSFMLLLTAVRRSFYAQRGKLCYKNLKRSLEKQEQPSMSDEGWPLVHVHYTIQFCLGKGRGCPSLRFNQLGINKLDKVFKEFH